MITVKEADEIIWQYLGRWGSEVIPLEMANGRVLDELIEADRNFPPFDRVTMDGIAIREEDFLKGTREFRISGMQMAGQPASTLELPETAIEVMTGAIMPNNADAVVRYEDIKISSDGTMVQVHLEALKPSFNVHHKGRDHKIGDTLLRPGTEIGATEIGVLATVGKTEIKVRKHPKIAVISTGDEIVPVTMTPLEYQIRMSNSYTIHAYLEGMGVSCDSVHLTDDFDTMLQKMQIILSDYDVVILSGGVSKGKADHVPGILEALGVKKLFHRVAQRPGKPFWFGALKEDKCVFALPGNPVSTFMCFIRYVAPWLNQSLGLKQNCFPAVLTKDVEFRAELTYFLQVEAHFSSDATLHVTPMEGGGSGDLSNMVKSSGFLELTDKMPVFKAGEIYPFYPFRTF